MPMPNENVWVIKNQDGYYVNANFRALFTGRTTGFTCYSNEETMKKKLEMLGEGFHCEYVNLKNVPDGERVYEPGRYS